MVADATARLFDWTGFGGNVRDSLYGNADVQQLNQQLQQQALAQSCDFLRKVRPLIILAAMVMAMIMAYNAVKEL